jgi:tRNA threonylcarbamoyladenosine biosynthesis protein TsaB
MRAPTAKRSAMLESISQTSLSQTSVTILAIETSHSPISLAIAVENKVMIEHGTVWQRTSEEILPLLERLLTRAGITLPQLDAVALSNGPGSFTALRIGMSTAKGLCFALDKPLITVGTLEAMAQAADEQLCHRGSAFHLLVPAIYSKADEFFIGATSSETLRSDRLAEIPKSYLKLSELSEQFPKGTGKVLCGRSPEKLRAQLHEKFDWYEIEFSAAALLPIAKEKLQQGIFTGLAFAEPMYLKNFEAKQSAKKFFG